VTGTLGLCKSFGLLILDVVRDIAPINPPITAHTKPPQLPVTEQVVHRPTPHVKVCRRD
jgi:hypothetical protein